MRVIELSNHPGDMLNEVSRRRQCRSRSAPRTIRGRAHPAPGARPDHTGQARPGPPAPPVVDLAAAQPRRPGRRNAARPAPARPATPTDTDAEEKIRAGIAGEQLVAAELGRALTTTGRCCTATATGAARSTTCSWAPRPVRHRGEEHQRHRSHRRRPLARRQVRQLREPRRAAAGRRPAGTLAERADQRAGRRAGAVPARARPARSPSSASWSSPTAARAWAPSATPRCTSPPRPATC